jgi:hypothetical protein
MRIISDVLKILSIFFFQRIMNIHIMEVSYSGSVIIPILIRVYVLKDV